MEWTLNLLAGAILGTLTGLGIGGGSLLLLWLTGIRGLSLPEARGISLLFFFPSAALSCFLSRKQLSFRKLLPAMAAGCLSAWLFSRLTLVLDPDSFRKALGLLFLGAGLGEILRKPKTPEKKS